MSFFILGLYFCSICGILSYGYVDFVLFMDFFYRISSDSFLIRDEFPLFLYFVYEFLLIIVCSFGFGPVVLLDSLAWVLCFSLFHCSKSRPPSPCLGAS